MKQLIIICLVILFATLTKAQNAQYHLIIKSIKVDGKPQYQERIKKEMFSIMITTGEKGAAMNQFIGEKMVETGRLKLINIVEHKETKEKFAGYTIDYIWYPQGESTPTSCKIILRIVIANDGDHFKLDLTSGEDPIIQYEGDIKEIS